MSIPLEFSFNQAQLQQLVTRNPSGKIVVSVCGLRKEGKSEMYLCAEAYNKAGPIMTEAVILACPNPPGWRTNETLQPVEHASLVYAPKFAVSAAILKASLPKNQGTIIKEKGKSVKLINVGLEARLKGEAGANGYQDSESVISFKIQKNEVKTIVVGGKKQKKNVQSTIKTVLAKAY